MKIVTQGSYVSCWEKLIDDYIPSLKNTFLRLVPVKREIRRTFKDNEYWGPVQIIEADLLVRKARSKKC